MAGLWKSKVKAVIYSSALLTSPFKHLHSCFGCFQYLQPFLSVALSCVLVSLSQTSVALPRLSLNIDVPSIALLEFEIANMKQSSNSWISVKFFREGWLESMRLFHPAPRCEANATSVAPHLTQYFFFCHCLQNNLYNPCTVSVTAASKNSVSIFNIILSILK